MSHIHHLPNEILAHIFALGHRALHARAAVVFLASITATCRLWRDLGLYDSSLWTSIAYCSPETGLIPALVPMHIEMSLARIGAYIERSKTASLDFFLVSTPHRLDVGRAVVRLILPHLQRCRTIRLQYTRRLEDVSSSHRLLPLPGPMLRLEELHISSFERRAFALTEASNQSPLSVLHLHCREVDTTNISKGRISDLLVGGGAVLGSHLQEWELRSQCALALSTLASVSFYEAVQTSFPIIEMPNLKQLRTSLPALRSVPGTISCPNLEELVLHDTNFRRLHTRHPIQELILPYPPDYFPWPKLRVLKTKYPFHLAEYKHLLTALPTLTTIICYEDPDQTNGPHLGTSVLECLCNNQDVAPRLEVLKLEPPLWGESRRRAQLHEGLDILWDPRPLLRLDLVCVRPAKPDSCLDAARERHPDRFIESIRGEHDTLDHIGFGAILDEALREGI